MKRIALSIAALGTLVLFVATANAAPLTSPHAAIDFDRAIAVADGIEAPVQLVGNCYRGGGAYYAPRSSFYSPRSAYYGGLGRSSFYRGGSSLYIGTSSRYRGGFGPPRGFSPYGGRYGGFGPYGGRSGVGLYIGF